MKKIFAILSFLILCQFSHAQKSQVQSAWRHLTDYETGLKDNQKGDLKYLLKAKESIDKALLNEDTKNQTKTHTYKLRISYAIYKYNFNEELLRLEPTVQDKMERYTLAYGNTSLVEYDEAANELNIITDLDPKFISTIQAGIESGAASMDEENLKFAVAVQLMKEEAPNIASGKYKVKNYELAADYFYKAAVMNTILYKTKDTANFYNACIASVKSKNPDKIIDYDKKMIEAKLDIPFNYTSMSDAFLTKKDTVQAITTLEKGREKFPENFEILTKQTDLFLSTNKQAEALGNLKLAIQKEPKNGMYYLMIGNIYDNMANPKDKASGKDAPKPANFEELFKNAEINYLKAIDLNTGNPDYLYNSLFNLGAMYNNQGAYIENKKIDKITDLAKYQKENAALSQQYYIKAIPYLEQALVIKPDDRSTMNALRLLYFKTGNDSKAKEMSEKIKALK